MVDVRRHASKAADPGDPRLIVGCTLSSALFAVARPHRTSILCFHTASADSGLRAGRLAAVIAGRVGATPPILERQEILLAPHVSPFQSQNLGVVDRRDTAEH